jgi:hypothetical protein
MAERIIDKTLDQLIEVAKHIRCNWIIALRELKERRITEPTSKVVISLLCGKKDDTLEGLD